MDMPVIPVAVVIEEVMVAGAERGILTRGTPMLEATEMETQKEAGVDDIEWLLLGVCSGWKESLAFGGGCLRIDVAE
jgi:hypothetical protein